MGAPQTESQGPDLERKSAIRRSSVPAPAKKAEDAPAPVPASASAPTSPKVPQRAPSPAPSFASDASDASLNSISLLQGKYESLRSGFTFPSDLTFAPAKGPTTPASTPSLPYNPTNAPVHAYENALTNLLTELDAVESFGDEHVRDVRRSLVKSVEAELEVLEEKKREAWRNQQEVKVVAPVPVESTPRTVEPESVPAPAPAPAAGSPLGSPVEPTAETAPEPEVVEEHAPTPATEAATTQPEAEQPAEQESSVADEPVTTVPETEPVLVESVPETEVAPASPVESVPVAEVAPASPVESVPASVTAASEPEVITKHETPAPAQVESTVTPPKSETEAEVPVAAKEPAPLTFVQVYPDSDSDIGTDADFASEMGEADRKSGDEFELI
ncbi:hypothetical protein RSAG8_00656, partial [Rhizoctonia solani AG-8 WAC10335]